MAAPTRTPAPRFTFVRDTAYRITVRDDDSGERLEYALAAYQGWLSAPDGIRHRFGAHRRTRTELRDDSIRTVVGP